MSRLMKLALTCTVALGAMTMLSCDKGGEEEKPTYTVTFDADGGMPAPAAQKVTEGEKATAPPSMTKIGYTFLHWSKNGAAAYDFATSVTANFTLTAKWEPEVLVTDYWQVVWMLNGGAWPAGDNHAENVVRGEALAEPAAPVRDGYTFDGWYKEEGLTNKVVFPYSTEGFTANFTLYAGWTEEAGLAAIAVELSEDADYSLFAAALADVSAESGNYTVFTLSNSVIEADTGARTLPVADVQWHIVRGKYGTEELLQAQTLQTVGGQTLTVACETVEIAGEEEMFLYINDIPLDYRSVRLMDGGAVYSIGSNINP